jgi:hypothetical protein
MVSHSSSVNSGEPGVTIKLFGTEMGVAFEAAGEDTLRSLSKLAEE